MAIEYAEIFLNISILENKIALRYAVNTNNLYKLFYGPYFKEITISQLNIDDNAMLDSNDIEHHFINPNTLYINTINDEKKYFIVINYTGYSINNTEPKHYPIYFDTLKLTILRHISYIYSNINNAIDNIPDSIVRTYNCLRKIYNQ